MHRGKGPPRVTYGLRDTRVKAQAGLHTNIGAFGRAFRYRTPRLKYGYKSILACKQAQEHPGLRISKGASELVYKIVLSYICHILLYTAGPENQRKVTSACLQVQRYKCLHIYIYMHTNIRRFVNMFRSIQGYKRVKEQLGLHTGI